MEEGVRVSHFFPVDSPAELVSRAPVLPPENCLLFGPLRCGKTTLLFTFAANAAAACSAARSVVLCRRSAVEASPPLLPPERAPPGALARVDMKYLTDDHELRRWCASSHLLGCQPACIAVDDLSALVDARPHADRRAREAALSRALALLHDSAAHATQRMQAAAALAGAAASPCRCQLLVSERSSEGGDFPPHLFIAKRWFPLVLAVRSRADGAGWAMTLLPSEAGPRSSAVTRYSRSATSLVLEGVDG